MRAPLRSRRAHRDSRQALEDVAAGERPPAVERGSIRHNMGSCARRTDVDRAATAIPARSAESQTREAAATHPTMTVDEQLAYLTKGCVDVVRAGRAAAKLERSAATGRPLVVKVGFDPTAPDLHLGHTVLIRKMKHFQDLGHRVVFVVGDFTGADRRSDRPLEDAPAAHAGRDRAQRRDLQGAGLQDSRPARRPWSSSTAAGSSRSAADGLDPARGAVQRRADARAARVQAALRDRPADRACTSSSTRWRRRTTRCPSRPTSSSAAPISCST